MKILKHLRVSYYLFAITLFAGCAKETTTRIDTTSNSSTQSIIAADEVTVNNEFDQAVDDAIMILCNHNATIPGAFPPDSESPAVYEIDYYGKEKDGTKTRAGNDSIHLNSSSWANPMATAGISFGDINLENYEVTFTNSTITLVLNGNATITNISGGLLQNLTPTDSLVVQIRGHINFTYNDANIPGITYYTWYFNQVRVFRLSANDTIATTRSDTGMNGYSSVGTWGTDRLGNSFYTSITSAVIQNISTPSLSYNPLSGTEIIEGISEPISLIYGVNSSGAVVTSGAPYGLYVSWLNNGGQATEVLPYYY